MIGPYRLEIFISGRSLAQVRFASFVKSVVESVVEDADVLISDVVADPARAEEKGVVATPQLVRWYPTPVRRVIGEVHDEATLIHHLEITTEPLESW